MYQIWPSFDCVVFTWVCVLVFPEAKTMGVCPRFLTHLQCVLSLVVKTHKQWEYMHKHILRHPLSAQCLQLPDVGCSPIYCAYKYYMNFCTDFIFICESWHDFFQLNGSINFIASSDLVNDAGHTDAGHAAGHTDAGHDAGYTDAGHDACRPYR